MTGPGVKVTITGAAIGAAGASVDFKLTDAAGVPLDRTGRLTTSKVNVAFVLAQLAEHPDGSPAQYTAYTANAFGQAATEAVETNFSVVDVTAGTYRYRLAAPLAGADLGRTQTVLAVVDRTVDGVRTFDRQTFSVRPGGGEPAVRELVTDESCDGCHKTLALHGGRYTSPKQCVLCHQPQSVDPETGNTVDFKVMIHKIHRGEGLPSVAAGTPYQIIGFGGSVNDFSTVAFPQNIDRGVPAEHRALRGLPRRRPGRPLEDHRLEGRVRLVQRIAASAGARGPPGRGRPNDFIRSCGLEWLDRS